MIRLAAFALLASLACGLSHAQIPVPAGEASSTIPLHGSVQTPQGKPIGSVRITVKSANGERSFSAETDSTGGFVVNVPAGQYSVTAVALGLTQTSDINVLPNQTANLVLVLGGARQDGMPVPMGEATSAKHDSSGDVPIPVSGAVAVAARFPSEKELTGWLNSQSARKLRLQAILITGSSKNLFVWISHPGIDQHIVVSASQINNPDDLQSILKTHPQATVIGLVSINNDRFLVLRNNP